MDYFLDPSWEHLLTVLAPFGLHFGSRFGHFLGIGAKVKIGLTLQPFLDFEGPDRSKIDSFSGPFLGRSRGTLFCTFCLFLADSGVPWGPPGAFFFDLFFNVFLGVLFESLLVAKRLQNGRGAYHQDIPYLPPSESPLSITA